MPFPKEYACRFNDPKKYKRFARKNGVIKIKEDKFADAIYGITDDEKVELQAVRFPINTFSMEEARNYCTKHKGI